LPYEINFGKGICEDSRKARLDFIACQGSHHIYGKTGSVVRLSVPVHKNQDLKIGLLKHLLKQADLSEQDL